METGCTRTGSGAGASMRAPLTDTGGTTGCRAATSDRHHRTATASTFPERIMAECAAGIMQHMPTQPSCWRGCQLDKVCKPVAVAPAAQPDVASQAPFWSSTLHGKLAAISKGGRK